MSNLSKEVMTQAYSNISFSPEKRGLQDFEYYSQLLADDLEALGENTGNYREKFIDKVMTYYHRLSRTASAFICGPANFPVARNQKRMDSADKSYNDFWHWREKYFKAVNRVRTKSPEQEIDDTLKDLDALIERKEQYKMLKKEWDKDASTEDKLCLINAIVPNCSSAEWIAKNGVTYQISSLTTRIRERKKKLELMKVRIERKAEFERINFEGGYVDIENDRVVICHDEKPSKEIIQAIKSNGFRWSPKCGNWCRKHTGNAIYSANYLVKNHFGGKK